MSFAAGWLKTFAHSFFSIICYIGGTDSVSSHSHVPTADKTRDIPVAPIVPVSQKAIEVLNENGASSLYRKFSGLKLEVRLRTKGSIAVSRLIMNGCRRSWRHKKFLTDKAWREEFGSSEAGSGSCKAGLGHFSSVYYDRIIKIIVERHFEGNVAMADDGLRRLGRAFVYIYCQAVLFPELCQAAYADVLGSYYLAEVVFTRLTMVDKDKDLEAKFIVAMEACRF